VIVKQAIFAYVNHAQTRSSGTNQSKAIMVKFYAQWNNCSL